MKEEKFIALLNKKSKELNEKEIEEMRKYLEDVIKNLKKG